MTKSANLDVELLFTSHFKTLVNYLRKKNNSSEDAEDIAHNAFIRIHTAKEKDNISNPQAYLYRTASNILIDMKRRERIEHQYLRDSASMMTESDSTNAPTHNQPGPDRIVSAQNDLRCVESAIESLPQNCRQAFLLHRVKGMSYEDIAINLGVSVSSVEKYILQALKHCRKAIKQ